MAAEKPATEQQGSRPEELDGFFTIIDATTDELRKEGKRTYNVVIGGILLLATSLQREKSADALPAGATAGSAKAVPNVVYEHIGVLGERKEDGQTARVHLVQEFTPPLTSEALRVQVIAHIATAAFGSLATSPAMPSIALGGPAVETVQLPDLPQTPPPAGE